MKTRATRHSGQHGADRVYPVKTGVTRHAPPRRILKGLFSCIRSIFAQSSGMSSEAKRFLSIRLTQDQFDNIRDHLQRSACRSLTEYAIKVLTQQPVIIKVRDQTREDILHQLGVIKSLLEHLRDDPSANSKGHVLSIVPEIRLYLHEIAEKCSR